MSYNPLYSFIMTYFLNKITIIYVANNKGLNNWESVRRD